MQCCAAWDRGWMVVVVVVVVAIDAHELRKARDMQMGTVHTFNRDTQLRIQLQWYIVAISFGCSDGDEI